ncbi:MAG: DUF4870 domain-containing protein [Chloroflexi bacterium]|nr:DUF4870 domain-containing protein [Chloroflexota bacterium]
MDARIIESGAGPSVDERNWAAAAHASAVLTLVIGAGTGGLGVLPVLLVPLGIYLYHRQRSRYVAFHALQAVVFQAAGAVAWLVVAVVFGGAIALAWIISGLLAVILIGLLLMPFALLLTIGLGLLIVAFPFVIAGWGLYGAWQAYHDRPFEYRWVGDVVARGMEAA